MDPAPESRLAFYCMEGNAYLGACLAVVYVPTAHEVARDALTGQSIAIYIASDADLSGIATVVDLRASLLFPAGSEVLLRIGSECHFGIFGDSHCDCEQQRQASLERIREARLGVYVHLPQEAQGQGLYYKARELQLQVRGVAPDGRRIGQLSQPDAARFLTGHDVIDQRSYGVIRDLFVLLGFSKYRYRLITSNPAKMAGIGATLGLEIVGTEDTKHQISVDNAGEFLAKLYQKKFALSVGQLAALEKALAFAPNIPKRTLDLLRSIDVELKNGRDFGVSVIHLQRVTATASRFAEDHQAFKLVSSSSARVYDEFHCELVIEESHIPALLQHGWIRAFSKAQYEENKFYRLTDARHLPAPEVKIRLSYDLFTLEQVEQILIYKSRLDEDVYRIRSANLAGHESVALLDIGLRAYASHVVNVIAHLCESSVPGVKFLVKRYSGALRTVSIMGPPLEARAIVRDIVNKLSVRQIKAPTDFAARDEAWSLVDEVRLFRDQELALHSRFAPREPSHED